MAEPWIRPLVAGLPPKRFVFDPWPVHERLVLVNVSWDKCFSHNLSSPLSMWFYQRLSFNSTLKEVLPDGQGGGGAWKLPKSNALSQIMEHWMEKQVYCFSLQSGFLDTGLTRNGGNGWAARLDRKLTLQYTLKRVISGLMWLTIRASGGLSQTQRQNFGFHNKKGNLLTGRGNLLVTAVLSTAHAMITRRAQAFHAPDHLCPVQR